MIKVLLWDVDGTLLDFIAAEYAALRSCARKLGLAEPDDAAIARYSKINRRYWERMENGEITKAQVLVDRFREFFEGEGYTDPPAEEFNALYQVALGETAIPLDNSLELLAELRPRVKQYAVTNGTAEAQKGKLERSGLGALFDGIFISDEIGVQKPDPAFFDYVFDHIPAVSKDEIMIVGDSQTSDMRGGMNAGIRTCYYNPHGEALRPFCRVDHIITDLWQILPLL